MDVSKTKRNYLWQTALLTLLIGGAGGAAYYTAVPQHYFGGYPLIPVFYFLFGWLMISIVERCRRKMPKRLLQVYLLLRVMRMLASVVLMVAYCLAVRDEAKFFLLTFVANYVIYLTYDSWFFFTFEMNRKLKKEKGNETIA